MCAVSSLSKRYFGAVGSNRVCLFVCLLCCFTMFVICAVLQTWSSKRNLIYLLFNRANDRIIARNMELLVDKPQQFFEVPVSAVRLLSLRSLSVESCFYTLMFVFMYWSNYFSLCVFSAFLFRCYCSLDCCFLFIDFVCLFVTVCSPSEYAAAVAELRRLDSLFLPFEKMAALIATCQCIYATVRFLRIYATTKNLFIIICSCWLFLFLFLFSCFVHILAFV